MKGKFFTLEGNEGAGKGTQIKMLQKALEAKGYSVDVLREPGSTSLGERVRSIIKDNSVSICSTSELFLFQASRAQLIEEVISPSLEKGNIVIADRFFDSTWVYQGYCRGVNLLAVEFTNGLAVGSVPICKTFLLDVPVDVCVQRIQERKGPSDRFEGEGLTFLNKIHAGYKAVYNYFPARIQLVDGNRTPEEVHNDLLLQVERLINE